MEVLNTLDSESASTLIEPGMWQALLCSVNNCVLLIAFKLTNNERIEST